MLEANEMKVLRKIVGKANKSENPVVSNLLMSEWKKEEEIGMNM
jgi:hypothetical protein